MAGIGVGLLVLALVLTLIGLLAALPRALRVRRTSLRTL